MESQAIISRLYQQAAALQVSDFYALFSQSAPVLTAADRAEAHRLCAQLKLLAADRSFCEDLRLADDGRPPQFPCLFSSFLPKSPNRFVVFSKSEGALDAFQKRLPEADGLLRQWYGEAGSGTVFQIHSEILYFSGRHDEAVALALKQRERADDDPAAALMAGYVLFRCRLAMGMTNEAETHMLDIIRVNKENAEHPTCSLIYRCIRDWANLTTGWSGDTPRYHRTPDGSVLPVLEDRAAAIQKGISQLSPTEEPFAKYARLCYDSAYTMRQLYMDIFYAMDQYRAGNRVQAQAHFHLAYLAASTGGLVMPFVEYGKQIIPLLDGLLENDARYSPAWIQWSIPLAREYEESLNQYRSK